MGQVLDAADAFTDRRAVIAFARLTRLADAQERALRQDPDKYLKAAGEEICRLRRAIEAAYEALHPSMSFVPPDARAPLAMFEPNYAGRCDAAGDILWEALGS